MNFLGIVIMVLGVLLILIGVIGAALKVFAQKGQGVAAADSFWKLVPEIIGALTKAPSWLAMILVGVFLVWCGQRLISGLPIFG
jgi:hypothetical protein